MGGREVSRFSHLSRRSESDLAPAGRGLPGFVGPIPPPLLIRVLFSCCRNCKVAPPVPSSNAKPWQRLRLHQAASRTRPARRHRAPRTHLATHPGPRAGSGSRPRLALRSGPRCAATVRRRARRGSAARRRHQDRARRIASRHVRPTTKAPKSRTMLRPRRRISWARRQSSCSILSRATSSQAVVPRAQSHSSVVRRTARRSSASCLASVVLPAPGNPQVSISRTSLTAPRSATGSSSSVGKIGDRLRPRVHVRRLNPVAWRRSSRTRARTPLRGPARRRARPAAASPAR